ncbi:MAG: DUF6324 family protein [Rhodobacteraceae bacterium]|nr:DUF6324 family protein [Paracoccaceae bacterium]
MGRNGDSDLGGTLQVGPTELGMVRIEVTADNGVSIPLDFDPDEALDIAEELQAAAEAARARAAVRPRPPKR